MFKTIITFAALATLTAATIAPAHALRSSQGISTNGAGDNGISTNGGGENGGGNNGEFINGGGTNSRSSQGIQANGQGPNGGGANGAASSSSTLSIQAIELPPEAR